MAHQETKGTSLIQSAHKDVLKPSELRIGNLVDITTDEDESSCLCVVEEIAERSIYYSDFPGRRMKENARGFSKLKITKGIPLTEDWLLKFGFVKINESDYLSPHSCYCFDIKRMGMMVEDGRENGEWHFCDNADLEYVHQLQNLYFALTGEELTVKETA